MDIQEIKAALNVDILVMMFSSRIVDKSQNIGTFGIGGCTCAIAEKGDKVYLGHYPPTHESQLVRELLAFGAEKITIFTPGEWVEIEGKWKMQPKKKYFGIVADYVAYSETRIVNDTVSSTAAAWVNGKIESEFLYRQ